MPSTKPIQQNRSGIATIADSVMTPTHIAELVINHFKPKGKVLEPARGTGNIYNLLSEPKAWCEITEGKDFFDYTEKVDWVITNPPYSIYDLFLEKAFSLADNVVFLVPLQKAFKSMKTINMVQEYGGLKEIFVIGGGGRCGFPVGFPVGCLHYQRQYKGKILFTVNY